jgi:UDP-3-O-[3-hydroxymyristoyl] glucosamine N-acyltransferase
VLVAVGYASMRARREIYERVRRAGYTCCNLVCAGSMVSPDVDYGENNIFFPGVVVEPYVRLGDNNVLWSGAVVSHDTSVGSHNYCAPRVAISGNCTVGDLCFFGAAAAVIDGVDVASETYLRAGSTLFEDTRSLGKYAGNPAVRAGEIDPLVGLQIGGKRRMELTDG